MQWVQLRQESQRQPKQQEHDGSALARADIVTVGRHPFHEFRSVWLRAHMCVFLLLTDLQAFAMQIDADAMSRQSQRFQVLSRMPAHPRAPLPQTSSSRSVATDVKAVSTNVIVDKTQKPRVATVYRDMATVVHCKYHTPLARTPSSL